MTGGEKPVELGKGIFFYDGVCPDKFAELKGRHHFLDVLWLPVPLQDLSDSQIFVINRFREKHFSSDWQFKKAAHARKAILSMVAAVGVRDITEIGCGKFPLAPELGAIAYRAIDIDPEAQAHCREMGLAVVEYPLALSPHFCSDIFVSLYAFHFALDSSLLDFMSSRLSDNGCVVFNAIIDDSVAMLAKVKLLLDRFPHFHLVKTDALAKREFFFVMGKPSGATFANQVAQKLAEVLS